MAKYTGTPAERQKQAQRAYYERKKAKLKPTKDKASLWLQVENDKSLSPYQRAMIKKTYDISPDMFLKAFYGALKLQRQRDKDLDKYITRLKGFLEK